MDISHVKYDDVCAAYVAVVTISLERLTKPCEYECGIGWMPPTVKIDFSIYNGISWSQNKIKAGHKTPDSHKRTARKFELNNCSMMKILTRSCGETTMPSG